MKAKNVQDAGAKGMIVINDQNYYESFGLKEEVASLAQPGPAQPSPCSRSFSPTPAMGRPGLFQPQPKPKPKPSLA